MQQQDSFIRSFIQHFWDVEFFFCYSFSLKINKKKKWKKIIFIYMCGYFKWISIVYLSLQEYFSAVIWTLLCLKIVNAQNCVTEMSSEAMFYSTERDHWFIISIDEMDGHLCYDSARKTSQLYIQSFIRKPNITWMLSIVLVKRHTMALLQLNSNNVKMLVCKRDVILFLIRQHIAFNIHRCLAILFIGINGYGYASSIHTYLLAHCIKSRLCKCRVTC